MRETLLMAGSSGVSFLVTLARTKLVALAWGPVGVGTIGMMQAAMSTATLVSGLGVDAVVTRELAKSQVAKAVGSPQLLSAATRGVTLLALAGMLAAGAVFVLLREQLGLGSGRAVAVIAAGVFLSVASVNVRAVLAGVGRLNSIAKAGVLSALAALVGTAVLVLLPGRPEVWAMAVVLVPLVQLGIGRWYFAKLPAFPRESWTASAGHLYTLARQAGFLAIAGVLPVLAQLLSRSFARSSLSADQFGFFQASMALAATSVSVLASSVGPSVLPRLSAAANSPGQLSRVVNEQASAYLTLFAPVVLLLTVFPEFVVRVLYSREFGPVAEQLSWQIVGEIVRLPSWVLATVLTARGRTRAYLLVESVSLVALVVATTLGAATGSLSMLGVAIAAASLVQFIVLLVLVRPDGIRLSRLVWLRLTGLIVSAVVLAGLARTVVPVRVLGVGLVALASWRALQTMLAARSERRI